MAENGKELRAVLLMQAEILGRLEALEQQMASGGSPMEDRMTSITGMTGGRTYDDPRLEALARLRDRIETGENKGLDVALKDIMALTESR